MPRHPHAERPGSVWLRPIVWPCGWRELRLLAPWANLIDVLRRKRSRGNPPTMPSDASMEASWASGPMAKRDVEEELRSLSRLREAPVSESTLAALRKGL